MSVTAQKEMDSGDRFSFGANWSRFLRLLDQARIDSAVKSLQDHLHVTDLQGKRFLDAGSGSGLFSLAARQLGAQVHSFDFDPASVACTRELKRRFFPTDDLWLVEHGSVLDASYLEGLGQFDIVYSWGVLHHTGDMRGAMSNVSRSVKKDGRLFIAIYNDQGWVSGYWSAVKRAYVSSRATRPLIILTQMPYLFLLRYLVRAMTGRLKVERGMSLWYDMIDWVGGYPFEVARPEDIFSFVRERGFELTFLKTCGGRLGCNEYVFRRVAGATESS